VARSNLEPASLGLRAKSGRAIGVILSGPSHAPRVVRRVELLLSDPSIPGTAQPYHEVMDLPWEQATISVRKFTKKIEAIASRALAGILKHAQSEGHVARAVGIVGAGNRDPGKIGSTHIRAHAAEGVLFRAVLEIAADASKVRRITFDQKNIVETAALELKLSPEKLRARLAEMGRAAGSPWRADEKAAAAAAWVALVRSSK
jgi:hypothetical protein